MSKTTHNIVIFASGGGSNARKIIEYFEDREDVDVSLIITNKRNAGVLDHAREFAIPRFWIDKDYFYNSNAILDTLKREDIDLIVLAGFLWLIPEYLVNAYPDKIINIHPALLPKYGGKGMYGHHVHKAVKTAGEKESGLTIHFVNQKYDEGKHIFQTTCKLSSSDTPEDIAKKVLALEHKHYAPVIDQLLKGKKLNLINNDV